jgi:hypothetical protein
MLAIENLKKDLILPLSYFKISLTGYIWQHVSGWLYWVSTVSFPKIKKMQFDFKW